MAVTEGLYKMKTYTYKCHACNFTTEHNLPLPYIASPHNNCKRGTLHRVYKAHAVHFKGRGFYSVDSRKQLDTLEQIN